MYTDNSASTAIGDETAEFLKTCVIRLKNIKLLDVSIAVM